MGKLVNDAMLNIYIIVHNCFFNFTENNIPIGVNKLDSLLAQSLRIMFLFSPFFHKLDQCDKST